MSKVFTGIDVIRRNNTRKLMKELKLSIGDTSQDMYLKPLNPDWLEQEIRPMSECTLVGRVVGKYTSY